jgi:hypothetical protein
MTVDPLSLVDLERYPIHQPGSAGFTAVVSDARRQLEATGAAELSGFVDAAGVAALVADAASMAERAFHSGGVGTAYVELPDEHWASDHPRKAWSPYAIGAVGYDAIPAPRRCGRSTSPTPCSGS